MSIIFFPTKEQAVKFWNKKVCRVWMPARGAGDFSAPADGYYWVPAERLTLVLSNGGRKEDGGNKEKI